MRRVVDDITFSSADAVTAIAYMIFKMSRCFSTGTSAYRRAIVEIFLLVAFDEKSYMKNNSLRSFIKEALLNKSD